MPKVIAIHQPNYLPWLGYFDKIRNSDTFVFLDSVAYSKGSLTNRNRIKTPQGWCWLTIPVRVSMGTSIREVAIDSSHNWQKKHSNSIKFNYGSTSCFGKYKDFFETVYDSEWTLLADLNKYLIKKICGFLGIEGTFIDASALDVKGSGTDLLVNLCEALDADVYLSGSGGSQVYLDSSKFGEKSIGVTFQDFQNPPYPQQFGEFIPNLSVVDFLLNCGAEK